MVSLVRTIGEVVELLVVVAALGWLPWRLVPHVRDRVPAWIGAPFIGVGVLQLYGWFWLEYSGRGLRIGLVVLALVWLVAVGVSIAVVGRELLRPLPRWSPVVAVGAVVLGAVVAVVLFLPGAFGGDKPVPATLGNADVVAYSLVSEHLADAPYSDPGSIDGGDLGGVGRLDAAGTRIVMTTAGIISDTSVWLVAVPVMAFSVVLVALAGMWIARLLLPGSWSRAALIGLAIVTPYCFGYTVGQYFLSQVLSMAAIVALLGVYMVAQQTRSTSEALTLGLVGAFVLAPVLLSYPHMAILSQGIVIPVAYMSQRPSDWLRRWFSTLLVVGVTVLIAAALVAPALGDLVARARMLASIDAGWPLGLISPFGALGAMRYPQLIDPTAGWPTSVTWWGQLAIVFVVAAVAGVQRHRQRARWPWFSLVGSVMVLGSYRLVFQTKGYSYQQWKWLTFFLPILSLAVLCAIVSLGLAVLTRLRAPSVVRNVVGVAAAVLWFGATLSATRTLSDRAWPEVTPELAQLSELRHSGLTDVTVDLDPFWESMWAAYFLQPIHTSLQNPSYFGVNPGPGPWVIVHAPGPQDAVQSIPINDRYTLICRAEPCEPIPDVP